MGMRVSPEALIAHGIATTAAAHDISSLRRCGKYCQVPFWNDTEQLRLNVYANTTDAPVPDYFNGRVAEIVWGRFLGNVVSALAY